MLGRWALRLPSPSARESMLRITVQPEPGRYLLGLVRCSSAYLIASGTLMAELVRTIGDDWAVLETP